MSFKRGYREPSELMKYVFIVAVLALGAITRLSVLIEDAGRAVLGDLRGWWGR